MSAFDLASSPSEGEWDEAELFQPAASTLGSRYKRIVRSKSSVSATNSRGSSTLSVVKLEVKAPEANRSGLLAAQLKGYALVTAFETCHLGSHPVVTACCVLRRSPLPSSPASLSAGTDSSSNKKRNGKLDSPKATLATVDELSSASVESATSNARLPLPVSPSSGNTSPLAVPTKRQNTSKWGIRPADEEEFVPPHLMSAQTLPSDFVYAEDARPVSTSYVVPPAVFSKSSSNDFHHTCCMLTCRVLYSKA